MSTEWREQVFNKNICSGKISTNSEGEVVVRGKVNTENPTVKIVYWAANPPQHNMSYSGSGLPYHNPEQAFDNSNNVGTTYSINGEFEFKIRMPNSYYVGLGSLYIPPNVHIKVVEDGKEHKYNTIKLDEGIPFRTLTYPSPPSKRSRIGPSFYYEPNLPVRTQEQILRDSAYPCKNKMPDNFWGLKPPK